jgi:hypothetical protein
MRYSGDDAHAIGDANSYCYFKSYGYSANYSRPTAHSATSHNTNPASIVTASYACAAAHPLNGHWFKRGVDLVSDPLPFGRLLVWRAKRNQQRG